MAARKIKLLGGMENSKLLSRKSLSAKLGIRTTTKLSQKAPKQDFMTVFKRHSVVKRYLRVKLLTMLCLGCSFRSRSETYEYFVFTCGCST